MKVVRAFALVITCLCLAWAIALWATGGFDTHVLGKALSSHDAKRPVFFGSVALTLFILAGGAFRLPAFSWAYIRRLHVSDRTIALGLAAATFAIGLAYCTMAIGGSDSYGYVSQADLLLEGKLKVSQPWVAQAPWPAARWSFAPLGYRPNEGPGQWDILPTYAPGLPMLMAAAKLVGGQCAVYYVVPFLGAVMVLATYGIGCRLGSSRIGVAGAWLVATSPVFLFMLMAPMSDVAVSGVWTAAFYFLLGRNLRSTVAAGLLTALAILIRPNLVFLAGVLGLWFLLRAWLDGPGARRQHIVGALVYGACAMPGMLIIAGLNWHLRGTPFESGYGGLAGMFALSHVWPNITNYATYFVQSQTILAVIGVVALLVPLRRFWPAVADRSTLVVGALFVFATFAHYVIFLVFDAWWYLRFLLPCWPLIMLGVASIAVSLSRFGKPVVGIVATVAIIVLGVRGFMYASDRFVFELWKGDHKYVAIAQLVRNLTDSNSVVIAMQHTGSIRYYGGRMTLRFDGLEAGSLDTAVRWLTARGVHVYALLEEWELAAVKERFAKQRKVAAFDVPPIFTYEGPALIYFFDLERVADPDAPVTHVVEMYQGPRCVPPVPAPHLVFRP